MNVTRVYAATIEKSERDDHGNLLVYGKATSPALDLDEQVCDPQWLAQAMPKWFKSAANVREQHSNIAAGVGVDLERLDGDSWMLRSKVVDPISIKKVEEGVLKGYSIGIRNAKIIKDQGAKNGRIVGGDVVEVSLVDAPCNPEALLTLAKSAGGQLVEVEEYVEGRQQVGLTLAKALVPMVDDDGEQDGEPHDETPDIEGAQAAIAGICDLLISEATELKAGRYEEAYDISLLMDAICTLQRFICREQQQQAQVDDDGVVSYVSLAADAGAQKAKYSAQDKRDMVSRGHAILNENGEPSYPIGDKADLQDAVHAVGRGSGDHNAIRRHIIRSAKRLGAGGMVPENWNANGSVKASPEKTEQVDQGKNVNTEILKSARTSDEEIAHIAETIEKAVAKAVQGHGQRIETLSAEIARLQSMPVPGGPVLLRSQSTTSPQVSRAEYYKSIASGATDPSLRAAYRALAEDEESQPR